MPRKALSKDEVLTRQAEILDIAEALHESQGLEAVSLRRIAARAGVSATTPYRYFPSKERVLLGLRIRAYGQVRETLEVAAEGQPDPSTRLRAIASAYIEFALARPRTYALLFRVGDAPEDDPELSAAKAAALGVCERALAEADRAGVIHLGTDALTAAHLFWAAAHGAVSLHLGGQLVMGRSLADVAPTLIATLLAGLSPSEKT